VIKLFGGRALPAYPWEPTARTPSGDSSDRQGDFALLKWCLTIEKSNQTLRG